MAQLTVRNVSIQIVRTLKQRAAAHARSAEAEHREILRQALLPPCHPGRSAERGEPGSPLAIESEPKGEQDFATRARALRQRLRSTVDSGAFIRADRDRDTTA